MSTNPNKDPNMNTKLGIGANILSLIGYLVFPSLPLVSIIAFIVEKDNNFVRFHSLQSILLAVVEILIYILISFISFAIVFTHLPLLSCLLTLCNLTLMILFIGLRIFLAIQAFNEQYFKLPIIGQYAEGVIFKQKSD